jgi:hypothetical protein
MMHLVFAAMFAMSRQLAQFDHEVRERTKVTVLQ